MASIKYYLDTRRPKADGQYPLKIKVSINSSKGFLVNLKVSIQEFQWKNGEIVSHDNRKMLNSYIKKRYADISEDLYRLELSGEIYSLSVAEIKQRVEKRPGGKLTAYTFNEHYRRFMNLLGKEGTRGIYELTLKKVENFGGDQLMFKDISVSWLRDFENNLRNQGIAINTINLHMRNIRAVFNDAINEDKTEQNFYPFRKFKLRTEKTPKRSLTVEQIRKFRDFPCLPHQRQYIDIFMLIFYLRGINIIDLVYLKEIENGRVEYKRAKTGRLYSVKIEPEAQQIIARYRGTDFLIDVLDRYKDHRNYTHRINKNLKEVGSKGSGKLGLFPKLSTYYARHTWATLAGKLDIPKETIAASLGHGEQTVTDIYIDFDQKKVDEANRKVIDFVNG